MGIEKKIFILCPVRKVTPEIRTFLDGYVKKLEQQGHSVYCPHRDTNQNDPIGLNICRKSREGIRGCNEVHAYWVPESEGSLFDFGMIFMLEKPIYIINQEDIKPTKEKSFTNVLLELQKYY